MDHSQHNFSAPAAPSQEGEARFHVQGMHCASCATGLQAALGDVEGVQEASVDFLSGQAHVRGLTDPTTLLKAITDRGYSGELIDEEEDLQEVRARIELAQQRAEEQWKRRAIIGLSIWAPLEVLHWTLHSSGYAWLPWVLFAGSSIVMALVCWGFIASALAALKRGGTNMDTLISIGATTAYTWSLLVFVMQEIVGTTST